jgi:tubulin polyglutamylase TTLL6/13
MPPFLLNGYKFDFRFYILISRLEPFTFYLYEEGLARFCSHVYKPPTRETLDDRFCHLTNTSVNATNDQGTHKIIELSSSVIDQICHLDEKGRNLWARIRQVVILSIIAQYQSILQNVAIFGAQPQREIKQSKEARTQMRAELQKYFQILGIDIMLTDGCEPVVLELNDRPSLVVTYDVERGLKSRLVYDALNVVAAGGDENELAQRKGGWQQLFPMDENLPFGKAAVTMLRRSIQNVSGANHIWAKRAPTNRALNTSAGKRSTLPPLHQ